MLHNQQNGGNAFQKVRWILYVTRIKKFFVFFLARTIQIVMILTLINKGMLKMFWNLCLNAQWRRQKIGTSAQLLILMSNILMS